MDCRLWVVCSRLIKCVLNENLQAAFMLHLDKRTSKYSA